VPIGIATIAAALWVLPETRGEGQHRRLDVAGALTVTGGLTSLVYAIVRTETYSWSSTQVLVPLAIGLAFVAAFLVVETKIARSPLVPLRIFRSRAIAGSNLYMVLLYAAMFGSFYFETLYLQRILGYSPVTAGFAFLPITFALAAGSQIASRAVTRFGPRPLLLAGTASAALGLAWLGQITPSSSFSADLLGPFLLSGIGMGLSITPVAVAATAGVSREEAGLASGLLNTSRQIGISVGLAVLATVAADRSADLLAGVASSPVTVASALTDGYGRALDVGVLILVAAGVVASVAIAPLRRERGTETGEDLVDEVELMLDVDDAEMGEAESA
jgi:predicted MFS family arabinose efflux permease